MVSKYQTPRPTVLVACESCGFSESLVTNLEKWGYETKIAKDREELLTKTSSMLPDAILLDITKSYEGLETLRLLSQTWASLPVVVMSSDATIGLAVEATKLGAIDTVAKPPDLSRLRVTLDGVLSNPTSRFRQTSEPSAQAPSGAFEILGKSQAIADTLDLVNDVAQTDATVLILGESGTGKELLARAIHQFSRRSEKAFVPVNVAALPATLAESILFGHERGAYTGADAASHGWCEAADGGTLLLDEIGEMDVLLQAKLLRFLQDGSFMRVGANKLQTADVRVVAATNRDPDKLVNENRMREDLYYRLNVFPIRMPPLRERREDIPVLADAFLNRSAETHRKHVVGFTEDAMECLMSFDWPGNVRQLENLVTRMVLLTRDPYISITNVPCEIKSVTRTALTRNTDSNLSKIESLEKDAIVAALAETNGNAVAAAKLLGMGQATIYRKIKRFELTLKRKKAVSRPSA